MGPGGFTLFGVFGRAACCPVGGGPPASRPRRELLLVAPTDLRPPRGLPARSPSAPRASLGTSARSPARPRMPRGGLQSVGVSVCCPARPRRHPRAPQLTLTNFARNSPVTLSNLECASLELQRSQRLLKLPSNELRASFPEPAVSYVPHQRIQECSVFRGPTVPHRRAGWHPSWGFRTSL